MASGLLALLAAEQPDRTASLASLSQIPGGYSRVTSRAEIRWSDGQADTYILRSDPTGGGQVFTSDRDAEWALLQALRLRDEVSIPAPLWYDHDGRYFGTKCIVMQFCDGDSLDAHLAKGCDPDQAADIFVRTAAAIHRIPVSALPARMQVLGGWDSYLDSVIDVFRQAEFRTSENIPALRYVAAWLGRHRPPPVPLTLVHGDYQPGNILLPATGPPTVIDWEFGRVGDPREDLGYYVQWPARPHLLKDDPEGFLARYRAASGLSEDQVNMEVVQYFLMIGMARLLAQLIGAADAIGNGGGGALPCYLINAISHQIDEYLRICRPAG
jgi:aminoglycoside phosphotransferase (APT) family kinase protein